MKAPPFWTAAHCILGRNRNENARRSFYRRCPPADFRSCRKISGPFCIQHNRNCISPEAAIRRRIRKYRRLVLRLPGRKGIALLPGYRAGLDAVVVPESGTIPGKIDWRPKAIIYNLVKKSLLALFLLVGCKVSSVSLLVSTHHDADLYFRVEFRFLLLFFLADGF